MKNLIFLLVAFACIILIVLGINNRNSQPAQHLSQAPIINTATSLDDASAVKPTSTEVQLSPVTHQPVIKQDAQRFYPDNQPIAGSVADQASAPAEQTFQLTPSLMAKFHLIDKYNPGICYGAPSSPPQYAIDKSLADNKQLAGYLALRYKLSTDLEIYNKIAQIQGIDLTETKSGTFDFTFVDGQCNDATYYAGTVTVLIDKVSDQVLEKTSHSYR